MALALDCVCAGSGALQCSLTKLEWVIEDVAFDLPNGTSILQLTGGPGGDVDLVNPWTAQTIDLAAYGTPAAWLAVWDSLAYVFSSYRSLSSDDLVSAKAKMYLRATYSCGDGASTQEQRSYNLDTQSDVCTPDGLTINAAGTIGVGAVAGYLRHTRPLSSCYGFSVTAGTFSPKPKNLQTVDLNNSAAGSLVLCPSGGATPYIFGIKSGSLPGGMSLDSSTGEITGSPDGSAPGTPEIIFYVYDGNHAYAEVTCSFIQDCRVTQEYGNAMY